MEIEELKKYAEESYWNNKRRPKKDIESKRILLAKGISEMLEWGFKLTIWWIYDEKEAKKLFNFLTDKKRTCRLILDQNGAYSIELPKMDRDFFRKYSNEFFSSSSYGYTFEDGKKVIEIFEGGIEIKNK
ncbi:hypothetical protein HY449_02145 [Candidatus Pacearchaeota archaeon]|nr:hypothetical protein [Candidatus Pacearchaeota archaeon]